MQSIQEFLESIGFVPIDENYFQFNEYYVVLTYSSLKIYRNKINRTCKLFTFAKCKDEILWKEYLYDLVTTTEAIAFNNLKINIDRYIEVLEVV